MATGWPPNEISRSRLAAKAASAAASPKNWSCSFAGTPMRSPLAGRETTPVEAGRENGSRASKPAVSSNTRAASATLPANTEMQSRLRHAGTRPRVLSRPRLGLSPTTLLSAAGTRPEPAVSVPSAKLTRPSATASAEPELEPPEM
jgi:hypothetical protein